MSGRYLIERELGAGGMATVYLAHDERHDRKVAIKVLKPEVAAVLGAERFVVEIKATASLQHPHILPRFDSGEQIVILSQRRRICTWCEARKCRSFAMLRMTTAFHFAVTVQ